MQLNNNMNRTSFGEKYPIEKILYLASDKKLLRTSEVINTVKTVNRLTLKERNNLLRNRSLLSKCVAQTKEKIFSKYPSIAEWVKKINTASDESVENIVELAKQKLGKEIDIDLPKTRSQRNQYA